MYISILLLCCLNAGAHWHTGFLVDKNIIFQIIILSSVAADCAFEVIFGIIYSCKREHLSGVVIWTLQASCLKPQTFRTHFRSVDSEKNMSKRQQSLTRKPRSGRTEAFALLFFLFCFLTLRCPLTQAGGWRRTGLRLRVVFAACRGLRAARLRAVKTASLFVQQKAQLLRPLQNQLALP